MKRKSLLVLIAWLMLVPGPWAGRGSAQQPGGQLRQLGAPPTFPQKPAGASLETTGQIDPPALSGRARPDG